MQAFAQGWDKTSKEMTQDWDKNVVSKVKHVFATLIWIGFVVDDDFKKQECNFNLEVNWLKRIY